ncbi:MAG: M23 family metallopeptidase [Clostridiales bacterium]|nr:M23 family metallopeptidase [Clostridiales bacterium]
MKEKLLLNIKKYKNYILMTLTAVIVLAVILALALSSSSSVSEPSENVNTTPVNFVLPISNCVITKGYNAEELQYNSTLNCWEIHKGLDLLATVGDEVLACFNGKVTNIYTNYLEGTTIEITHEDGLVSRYQGLNSNTLVNVNDEVNVGQSIGTVANVLEAEGEEESHVHFELIKNGEKVDPANYIQISSKD